MLAPISDGRKDKGSSFRKLKDYLLLAHDPETGDVAFRGEFILSDNLASLQTADFEMEATAAQNPRCSKPVYHYQITWCPGERPDFGQWREAAMKTLHDLGFSDHQYLVVSHNDKTHFHVHMMVNKVHPESRRAQNPKYDFFTLDKAMRELEHLQGWKESPGTYRWDPVRQCAVKNTREERLEQSRKFREPNGTTRDADPERDNQTLRDYVQGAPARELGALLRRESVEWPEVHRLLCRHGLELRKADHGGYVVHDIGTDRYVKASDGFRADFSGKAARARIESKLGAWCEPRPEDQTDAPLESYERRRRRANPEQRQEQRERREEARRNLKERFGQYRTGQRRLQMACSDSFRERRRQSLTEFRAMKGVLRGSSLPGKERQSRLSVATAEHVARMRTLREEGKRLRLAHEPVQYRQWVETLANLGDQAAYAQLRGWRYRLQRVAQQAKRDEDSTVGDFFPASDAEHSQWQTLAIERLLELQRGERITDTIRAMRWTFDQKTGHVHYRIGESTAFVDKGREIAVLTTDEAPIVLALEMAVEKYGPRISATGSEEWKRAVARAAAHNSLPVEFTDPQMNQRKHLYAMAESLRRSRANSVELGDFVTAEAVLVSMYGGMRGKDLLQSLETAAEHIAPHRERLKESLDLILTKGASGKIRFSLHFPEVARERAVAALDAAGDRVVPARPPVRRVKFKEPRERTNDLGH